MEQIVIILTTIASVFGFVGLNWVFRKEINNVKNDIENKSLQEELKDIEDTKKRREVRDNTNVSDMRERLREYADRKK